MKSLAPLAVLILCALLAAAAPAGAATNRVCVIVQTNSYTNVNVAVRIAQYREDLGTAGFTPLLFVTNLAAPNLRVHLSNLYYSADSLAGAVLIGDVTNIYFELTEDWGGGPSRVLFPCDLFYMDLNGTWRDTNSASPFQAGVYDTWTGDANLEIWVCRMMMSRLTAPGMGGESNLLARYFDKNHRFREGNIPRPRRALVYNDDLWTNWVSDDVDAVRRVYGDAHVDAVLDRNSTTRTDYTNRIGRGYELVLVRGDTSAPSPTAHGFLESNGTFSTSMNAGDYRRSTPPLAFVSFGVPQGADYTVVNGLAGTVVFNTNSSGIAAWGTTKLGGGMWADRYFYDALAEGACIGEAFRRWYNTAQSLYFTNAPQWWYGMVLIGDASLKLNDSAAIPTNGEAYTGIPFSYWSAIAGYTYIFQRSDDLLNQTWSNVSVVVTAQDYSISFSDTNAGGKAGAYRAVRTTTPYTNLLRNGGFEIPGRGELYPLYWEWNNPAGWTNGALWGTATRRPVAGGWRSHAGDWETAICGSWFSVPSTNPAGIWQQVPAYPGTTYQASAWVWADRGAFGGVWTATIQQLKLEFYSTTDFVTPLAQYMTNLDHIVESWTQKAVSAVAPLSTAWARYVIYVDGVSNGGALQLDDAELKIVP